MPIRARGPSPSISQRSARERQRTGAPLAYHGDIRGPARARAAERETVGCVLSPGSAGHVGAAPTALTGKPLGRDRLCS